MKLEWSQSFSEVLVESSHISNLAISPALWAILTHQYSSLKRLSYLKSVSIVFVHLVLNYYSNLRWFWRLVSTSTTQSGTKMRYCSTDQSGCLRPRPAGVCILHTLATLRWLRWCTLQITFIANVLNSFGSQMFTLFSLLVFMTPFDFCGDISQNLASQFSFQGTVTLLCSLKVRPSDLLLPQSFTPWYTDACVLYSQLLSISTDSFHPKQTN